MNKNAKVIRQRNSKKKEIHRKASKGRHLIYNVWVSPVCDRRFIPNCKISVLLRSILRPISMCSSCSPPCLERQRIELPCFSSSCLVYFPSLFYTLWKTKRIVGKVGLCHGIHHFTTPLLVFFCCFLFCSVPPVLASIYQNEWQFRERPISFKHRAHQCAI